MFRPRSPRCSARPRQIPSRLALSAVLLLLGAFATSHSTAAAPLPASPTPLVHLPADQANHPHVNNEWWYVVGHLRANGRTFGFETTIFRLYHVVPPGFSAPLSVYRTDVAVTDDHAKRFHSRVTYSFPSSVRASIRTLDVHTPQATLAGASPARMTLQSGLPGASLRLTLASKRPPMYVGGRGYLPFGNGFTYYYSLTDLATSGTLHLNGRTYHVTGIAWLDHQWGNWSWRAIRGWTWMALQLSNGVQLSVFDFRGTTRVTGASVLPASGRTETLQPITIASHGTWHSRQTGGTYPSGWTVRIPAAHAKLQIEPTVRDQEVRSPQEKLASYWEGSGRITGTWQGKKVTGLSYTELTGYAGGFAG